MKHLLIQNGFLVKSQVHIPLYFKGMELDCDLRLDLLVEDSIIVEVKATEGIVPVHVAQLMTYLKLLDKPKGLLINFNCVNIKDNLKSVVTEKFAFLG